MTLSTNVAPDSAASQEPKSVVEVVGDTAGEYITELQRGYLADVGSAVALLAQLRRGAGKLPHEVPELWGLTGTERLYQEQTLSESDASRAEAALFVALTLYALHQQSRSDQGMHRPGVGLGAAVRRLMTDETDEPIRRRFVRIGTASTFATLAYRLREIVTLLRREAIPLDYAQLARELYHAQLPGGLAQVRRRWGRGFHAYRPQLSRSTTAPDGSGNSSTGTDDLPITDKETR